MNLLLADQHVPTITGTLLPGYPMLSGALSGPVVSGTLDGELLHDIVLVDGNASLTGGLDQRIDCTLRTFLGEFWLDPTQGMPYFQEFLKKSPDISVCKQALATVIQGVPGVASLDSLDVVFSNSTRSFRVDFTATGTDSIPVTATSEVLV